MKLIKGSILNTLVCFSLFGVVNTKVDAKAPEIIPQLDFAGEYEFYKEAEDEIFRLINDLRKNPQNYTTTADGGSHKVSTTNPAVGELKNSEVLRSYAQYKSLYMSIYEDFGHSYSKGPLAGVGKDDMRDIIFFTYSIAGENIAARTKNESPKEFGKQLFFQWVNSRGHLDNMMDDDFSEIGIGVGWSEGNDMVYGTQEFSRPAIGDSTTKVSSTLPNPFAKPATNSDLLIEEDNKLKNGILTIYRIGKTSETSSSFPTGYENNYHFKLKFKGSNITQNELVNLKWNAQPIAGFVQASNVYMSIADGSNEIIAKKSGIIQLSALYKGTSYKVDVVIPGDVSRDGILNTVDAIRIQKYAASKVKDKNILGTNDKYTETLADMNGDNIINTSDKVVIQKMVSKTITPSN